MPIKSIFPPVPIDERPFPEQYLEKLWLHASKSPTKTAMINAHNQDDRITFRELYLHTQSLASFLRQKGFRHRDVACIISYNCWEYLTVFGAVTSCGGALSGASYLFTEFEIQRQLLDNGASVVFCTDQLLERVKKSIAKCPKVKFIVVIGGNTSSNKPNIYSFTDAIKTEPKLETKVKYNVNKDTILIPYSSGTTGIPKGVQLTHRNMSATVAAISYYYGNHVWPKIGINGNLEDQYLLLLMPFYHVYGQSLVIYGLMDGMTSVIMKSFEPELFCASIQKYKIKLLKAVPPIVLFLAKSPLVDKYDLSSVVLISSGAAPLGMETCEEVKKRLPNVKYVVQGFGMSETSVASHLPFLSSNTVACGKLMPNMEMKIIDVKTGKELTKRGERGELCVKGPNVMSGYLNRPKETAQTIDRDEFLHTGDIGYIDDQDFLYIVDRLKELIKVKGLQVPPAELEDLLLGHPSIADCAVIGVPHEKSGEAPKAFIVRRDSKLTEKEVFDFVKEKVAPYKHLTGGIKFVDSIPKSPAGKILRRELRDAENSKSKL